jgi:lipid A 4'-phosphatase
MSVMTATNSNAGIEAPRLGLAWRVLLIAVTLGVLAGILFHLIPEFDIAVSAQFYDGTGFDGARSPLIRTVRAALLNTNFVIYVGALLGLLLALALKRPFLRIRAARWFFLLTSLVVGPGLVANTTFKDNWGRARPSQVVEFGGTQAHSLPLIPSDQCGRNCSFVAGEASTFYAVLFAMAFVFPAFAGRLFFAGIVAGSLAGLIRVSQGAHFLSDVVFAGILMAIVVALVQLVFQAAERGGVRSRSGTANARQRA